MNCKQKAVASMYVKCGGNQTSLFISYLMINCDKNNEIVGTYEALAVKANVSISSVKKTMSLLKEKGLIKKIHAGVYRLQGL